MCILYMYTRVHHPPVHRKLARSVAVYFRYFICIWIAHLNHFIVYTCLILSYAISNTETTLRPIYERLLSFCCGKLFCSKSEIVFSASAFSPRSMLCLTKTIDCNRGCLIKTTPLKKSLDGLMSKRSLICVVFVALFMRKNYLIILIFYWEGRKFMFCCVNWNILFQ